MGYFSGKIKQKTTFTKKNLFINVIVFTKSGYFSVRNSYDPNKRLHPNFFLFGSAGIVNADSPILGWLGSWIS